MTTSTNTRKPPAGSTWLLVLVAVSFGLKSNFVFADLFDFFRSDSLANGSQFAFAPGKTQAAIIAIDTRDGSVAARLELAHVPDSIVVSEILDMLIATDPEKERVSVIDLNTRELIAVLEIGMRPDAALLNPFDQFVAFGSRDGSVSVWDMKNLKEMLRVDDLESGEILTFGIDGRNLYVVEEQKKSISVIEMHERRKVADIALGGNSEPGTVLSAMSRSADGYTGFVAITSEDRVVIIDLLDWSVKRSVTTGDQPIRPYSTADNRFVLVPNQGDATLTVLSALSFEVVATIPTGVKAREINTGWLDTVAFIMPEDGNEIAVIDLRELKRKDPIKVSGRTDDGLVTSDSKMLVAAAVDNGEIVIIDTRTRSLQRVLAGGIGALEGIGIGVSNNLCH
jgi:DNA-binding beta-propeller fold protein YncE